MLLKKRDFRQKEYVLFHKQCLLFLLIVSSGDGYWLHDYAVGNCFDREQILFLRQRQENLFMFHTANTNIFSQCFFLLAKSIK